MKFNKSAESDFWYVGDDFNKHEGKLIYNDYHKSYCFYPSIFAGSLSPQSLDEIATKLREINRESGIDTTSTFTSNSDIK